MNKNLKRKQLLELMTEAVKEVLVESVLIDAIESRYMNKVYKANRVIPSNASLAKTLARKSVVFAEEGETYNLMGTSDIIAALAAVGHDVAQLSPISFGRAIKEENVGRVKISYGRSHYMIKEVLPPKKEGKKRKKKKKTI